MKSVRLIIVAIIFGSIAMSAFAAEMGSPVPLVIDVRTESEWNEGHLEGATLIPYDKIEQGITAIAPEKSAKIQLYCRSGRRSGIAAETLKNIGYQNLLNLGTLENAAKELHRAIVK